MVVEKGDTIIIPRDILGTKEQVVQWSQSLRTREGNYIVCNFINKTKDDEENIIYIQSDKLQEFKDQKVGGDDFTVVVDERFQYGQDKGGHKRWLCYHDKERKPYQHRFVESTIAKYGNLGAGFIDKAGFTDVNKVSDVAKHFIGDPLKSFT